MKYLYSFLIVTLLSFFANAQTFGVNFSGSVPTGEFKHLVNGGYTVGVTLQAPLYGFTGVLQGGYEFWDESPSPSAARYNYTNFPIVLGGARSYFGDFYLSTLAGIYPVKVVTESGDEKFEAKETQGAILASLGCVFPVSFFHVDVSVSYFWSQDYPQLQMTFGILFNK